MITLNQFENTKIKLVPYLTPDGKHETQYNLSLFLNYWSDQKVNIYFNKITWIINISFRKKVDIWENVSCFQQTKEMEINEIEEYKKIVENLPLYF